MSEWIVYRRDTQLRRTGVLPFVRLEAGLRWSAPSRAIIDTHTSDAGGLQIGDGLILSRDGRTEMSGVVAEVARTVQGAEDRLQLVVVDEVGRLARRVHPDPAEPAEGTQPARDVRTGPAGQVISQFVDVNAGQGAREERRMPGLEVLPSTDGGTVTGRGRWQDLIGFCAVLADRGGVGFCAVQQLGVPAAIRFEVVVPQDRFEARFDLDGLSGSGALAGFQARTRLPDLTVAYAGGRGELADRLIRAGEGAVEFGRWEMWLDRTNAGDEDDMQSQVDELDDAIADAIREGAVQADLDLDPIDSPALAWTVHYEVGDQVRVRLGGGFEWRQVRGVDVQVSSDGERVKPLLGDAARSQRLQLLARIGMLEKQVDERGLS